MTVRRSILTAAVGAALLAATSMSAQSAEYNLTLTGASPGGLWSRIGGGIDAALAKAYPGSVVTYQTSSGGLANVPLVSKGAAPMGMATDGDLAAAVNGVAPFKNKIENIRILFRAYTSSARFQMTHIMIDKDFAKKHGISSFADLVKKKPPVRVAINRRGNMDSDVSRVAMEMMGATLKDIESWGGQVTYAASKEIVNLWRDRRIDVANFGIAYNHPRIREIASANAPMLLSMPDGVASKVAKQFGGEVCGAKDGEYKWSDRGMTSVCVGALIFANSDMDDDTAYAVTKALVEQIEAFKDNSHKLIKKTATPQSLSTGSVFPFHPGSAKYLKEAGLM